MALDRLLAEIQSRGAQELADAQARLETERGRLLADRDRRSATARAELARQGELEARRERAQRIAGARMQARKLEYEARERALAGSLEAVREILRGFTRSPEYAEVLARMHAFAAAELGKELRVSGRSEDATMLGSLAGKGFDPTPRAILGGLVAESPDRKRRLTLSFDELLRLREDRVRELVA